MAFEIKTLLKDEKREREPREEKREEARAVAGVMIALDTYEDIFSDFDTRPFSERGISEDFLHELSQRALETPTGELEVMLVLPKVLRKEKDESTIKNRLRKHFTHEIKRILAKRDDKRRHGATYFAIGAGLLLAEVYVIEQSQNVSPIVFALAQAVALPAGWFFAYTGLEKILQPYGEDREQWDFAKKMHGANYRFTSYENMEEDARLELERLEKVAKQVREKAEALARQEPAKVEKVPREEKEKLKEDKPDKKEEKREDKKEEKKD